MTQALRHGLLGLAVVFIGAFVCAAIATSAVAVATVEALWFLVVLWAQAMSTLLHLAFG